MATFATKRSVMTLYSDPLDPYCHQVRIALAEKGITAEEVEIGRNNKSEDLYHLNPYGTLPTLVDRDLVLYESRIILEYLDERFPHPPLMPVYPVARAECRRMIHRIEIDWYSKIKLIKYETAENIQAIRKEIIDTLTSIAPLFTTKPYFLSDEFTLVDCWLAPLLWRLNNFEIDLPLSAKPVYDYAERIFKRESFKLSLTEAERALR